MTRLTTLWTLTTVLAISCGPTHRVTTQRLMEQNALVPAASGPAAHGPMPEQFRYSLEGSAAFSHVGSDISTSQSYNRAQVTIDRQLGGRVAIGLLDSLELGFSLNYADGSWSDDSVDPIDPACLERNSLVQGGPQLRIRWFGDQYLGGGTNLELTVASIPYWRRISTIETTTNLVTGHQTVEFDRSDRDHQQTIYNWKLGAFMNFQPLDWLHFTGGALVQNHPVFFRSLRADGVCYYDHYMTNNYCEGYTDSMVDQIEPSSYVGIGTAHGSVAARMGHFSLVGQLHWHFAGDEGLRNRSPFGGEVGLRMDF